jgi:anti-anti-sigma factor
MSKVRELKPGIRSDGDSLTIEKLRMKTFASSGVLTPRKDRPNVLPLEGEIDLHISPTLTESLNAMTAKKPEWIVIDLSRATYIDSAGLAALILAMQTVEAYGGKFFLTGPDETMRSILETSRLDQIFQIFPDVDAALAAI